MKFESLYESTILFFSEKDRLGARAHHVVECFAKKTVDLPPQHCKCIVLLIICDTVKKLGLVFKTT